MNNTLISNLTLMKSEFRTDRHRQYEEQTGLAIKEIIKLQERVDKLEDNNKTLKILANINNV